MPSGVYERKPFMKNRSKNAPGIPPKVRRWLLTPEREKIASALREGGSTHKAIAERLAVSRGLVTKIAREIREKNANRLPIVGI